MIKAKNTPAAANVFFEAVAIGALEEVCITFSNKAMELTVSLHPSDAESLAKAIADAVANIITEQEDAEQQLINFVPDEG